MKVCCVFPLEKPHRDDSNVGWSGGAMVLGKLPVPGRPTNLDNSRARAYCTCSRCGRGVVWTFFSIIYHFSLLSPILWETAQYRLKYCLKGLLNPKQPTNQPTNDSNEYTQYTIFNMKKKSP